MLLEAATPAILIALAVSGAFRLMMLERKQGVFLCLLILAQLALAWNWWFVWFVLRSSPLETSRSYRNRRFLPDTRSFGQVYDVSCWHFSVMR
jgi:hypothetical protein